MNSRDTLLNGGSLRDHFQCYDDNRNVYVQTAVETRSNKNVAKSIKNTVWAHVLTVVIQNKDRDAFKRLASTVELLEVVKACEILDTPRMIRQLKAKLAKKRNNTLSNKLVRLESEVYEGLSLTRTKIGMIREWVRGLTAKELIFQALMFPKEPWTVLADLCHLNPTEDFAIDWFLPYCFGQDPPEDSVIWKLQHGDALTVCQEYQLNYELARTTVQNRTLEFVRYYVDTEPLETVLWYYDEFKAFSNVIAQRLEATDLDLSYGKLVSLLMSTQGTAPELYSHLLTIAEYRMKSYNMNLESPIAVLGDASASMQVAINTSSIITSLLCSLADADLHLFKNVDIPCDNPPRTVTEAVTFAKQMQASNSTSPAASLYWYYQQKKAIKTFVIVTDEKENTNYDGKQVWFGDKCSYFAELYNKYCSEIGPAQLVFVSFTDPTRDGQMVASLKQELGESKAAEYISVYKFDTKNPDLRKLDYMLEKLAKPVETVKEKSWFSKWW